MAEAEAEWAPKQDMSLLCRVCANQHDYLIPIFQGEGLDHEMPTKMGKHLPIKVRATDKLPTQMCYQCASTIIAWSELHTNCLAADKKLKGMLKKDGVVEDDNAASDHYEDAFDDGGGAQDDDDEEDFEKEIKQLISDAGVELGSNKEVKRAPRVPVTRKRKAEVTITPVVKKEPKKLKTEPLPAKSSASKSTSAKSNASASKTSTALVKPKEEVVPNEERCIEVWSCCTCERNFSSQSGLHSHLCDEDDVLNVSTNDKTKRTEFTCHQCNEIFFDKKTLRFHMKIIHVPLYMKEITHWFKCSDCPKKLFKNCDGFTRHMLIYHNKCNINHKEYAVKSLLDITYACSVCGSKCYLSKYCSAHQPERNNRHMISNNCEDHSSLHVCNECDQKHKTCQALWSHMLKCHKNTSVKCNLCQFVYISVSNNGSNVIQHMLRSHKKSIELDEWHAYQSEKESRKEFKNKCRIQMKGKIVFSCPYCPKILQSFSSLQGHLNIHTGDKKYVCEVCGAWFLHISSLNAHKTTHSNNTFKCERCGKSYSHRNHLMRHIDQVHVNEWKSLCKICNKVFQNLNTHAAVHSTERPFVCTLCGSTYKWRKHLTRHEKICKTSRSD